MTGPLTLAELRHWEDSGASWSALELDEHHVVLELCTCYGDPVERRDSRDQALIGYVQARRRQDLGDV